MDKIIKRIRKYWITIWMVLSVAALGTFIAYGAYAGTAQVKRVVSTMPPIDTVFSSNYMENPQGIKNLHTTKFENYICPVTVCNFAQLTPTGFSREKIRYSLTAELVRFDSGSRQYITVDQLQTKISNGSPIAKTFYIKKTHDDNEPITSDSIHSLNSNDAFSYTFSNEELAGGDSHTDTFNVCFDAAETLKEMPDLYIRLTATPEDTNTNGTVTEMSCILSISKGRIIETGWHGALAESSATDYDGYNLIVEGVGQGRIDIRWDNTKFMINPAFTSDTTNNSFASNNGSGSPVVDDSTSDWKKITLNVNSLTKNRYEVQFYKRLPPTTYTGDNSANNFIKCDNYDVAE